jgi:tRNA threonylcarbamoyladenosine biosynthesis protein TsaB
MSVLLAIDTTTRGGSLALAADGSCRAVVDHDPGLGYAESLYPLLDALLEKAGSSRADIEAVAVVRGPGSFTGLRIGIMMAKSLAFARRGQLWTAETLPLLASGAWRPDLDAPVLALTDAGGGFAYAALFAPPSATGLEEDHRALVPAVRVGLEEIATWELPEDQPSVVVAGDPDVAERARAILPGERVLRFEENRGLARRLGELASSARRPAHPVPPAGLVPLYLSPSQAERTHGLDLREAVHRAIPPTGWE